MSFIEFPNLPQRKVKLVIIDGRIDIKIEKSLLEYGVSAIRTLPYKGVYNAIKYHSDIFIHHIGNNKIVYAPCCDNTILIKLKAENFELIKGETRLGFTYPKNIAYNVARIGKFAFHNLRYTDPTLKLELEKQGVELVHINQGYAKCMVCIVSENAIITSDKGIESTAAKKGINVLLIEENQNILLEGFKTGFIGGSTGLIDRQIMAFSGNIELLKSYREIYDFLSIHNVKPISLTKKVVVDIGSILPLLTV